MNFEEALQQAYRDTFYQLSHSDRLVAKHFWSLFKSAVDFRMSQSRLLTLYGDLDTNHQDPY